MKIIFEEHLQDFASAAQDFSDTALILYGHDSSAKDTAAQGTSAGEKKDEKDTAPIPDKKTKPTKLNVSFKEHEEGASSAQLPWRTKKPNGRPAHGPAEPPTKNGTGGKGPPANARKTPIIIYPSSGSDDMDFRTFPDALSTTPHFLVQRPQRGETVSARIIIEHTIEQLQLRPTTYGYKLQNKGRVPIRGLLQWAIWDARQLWISPATKSDAVRENATCAKCNKCTSLSFDYDSTTTPTPTYCSFHFPSSSTNYKCAHIVKRDGRRCGKPHWLTPHPEANGTYLCELHLAQLNFPFLGEGAGKDPRN
jgi:hypothetical protein